jgi:UDP:flavonoid glycosyltransferase YjiC (YdhE family)
MSERRTIAFFPEPGAWGPTNNCVAIAEVLKERGHRVVFIVDSSFEGVLEERGYEERMIRMAPAEDAADASEDPWSEFIRVTAPEFRKPTIEQQATVTRPIWETLVAGVRYSHDRMVAIWEDIKPDVVCTDNVTGYPAVELAGCPWVRFVSANPLEMRDPDLPPPLAGLPVDARSEWEAFREEYRRVHADLLEQHNEFRRSVGTEPCPPDEFNINSPFREHVPLPGSHRLHEEPPARRDVAPA